MRSLTDLDRTLGGVPLVVTSHLREIDLGAGNERLFAHQLPVLLAELADRARVQSITASSAIEGVAVPDPVRAQRVIEGRAPRLRTRDEQQLAGYRKVLDYLFGADWQPLDVGLVLHVHRLLWSETEMPGGHLKTADNLVADRSPDGSVEVRFRPVAAKSTDYYLRELVTRYTAAASSGSVHPVLLVGLFVLDLLIIHPFEDGNGRVEIQRHCDVGSWRSRRLQAGAGAGVRGGPVAGGVSHRRHPGRAPWDQ